jgi:glycosyltransferase involved in cell wall biosynthesis
MNGLLAVIIGRLVGARSLYFCVGGPPEVCDGGVHADDHLFAKMDTPDAVVEGRLIRLISQCDVVIAMGTPAVKFFRAKETNSNFFVVSGGIDSEKFRPGNDASSIDCILTGRLAPIKRIDVFLRAIKSVAQKLPDVKVVVVGDGGLRDELHSLSVDLGIDRNVDFVGRQDEVEMWLRRAKIFVLTSDSEGLSLSMMEAMMSGLPAVVSDVGDLGDLVENGVNGYLVPRRSPELFADRLVELLSDEEKLVAFSQAAHRSAMRYETKATTQRWDGILRSFRAD